MENRVIFQAFSAQHGWLIGLGALVLVLLLWSARRWVEQRVRISRALAIVCWGAYPISCVAWLISSGEVGLENWIPLQLCDVSAIVAGFTLWFSWQRGREILWCWGILGALQALATPALSGVGRWEAPVWAFFLIHFAIVAAAMFSPIVLGWRIPSREITFAWWRVMIWSQVYLATALCVNAILDTNFGFVSRKPPVASALDLLGPWPNYLLGMEGIAAVGFFALIFAIRGKGQSEACVGRIFRA